MPQHPTSDSFEGNFQSFTIETTEPIDVDNFMKKYAAKIKKILLQFKKSPIKVSYVMAADFYHDQLEEEETYTFQTSAEIIMDNDDRAQSMLNLERQFKNSISEANFRNSQWRLMTVKYVEVRVYKYTPLRGGCDVTLPQSITKKHAVVNIKSTHNRCFMNAMVAKYIDIKDRHKTEAKCERYYDRYNWVTVPMSIDDLDKFEKLNPTIAVNVYGADEEGCVYPLRVNPDYPAKLDVTDLLYYENHYSFIRTMARLVPPKTRRKNVQKHICLKCLTIFSYQKDLNVHFITCSSKKAIAKQARAPAPVIPPAVLKKNALLMPQNATSDTFKQAAIFGLGDHVVDWTGYESTVSLSDVKKFNLDNPSILVNVYTCSDKGTIYPLYVAKNKTPRNLTQCIHLFKIGDVYYFIKDLSRLVAKQSTRANYKKYICPRCLSFTYSQEKLDRHVSFCEPNPQARVFMPSPPKDVISFEKYKYKLKVPIVIYADWESILKTINYEVSGQTKYYQYHEACSFCMLTVNAYNPKSKLKLYRGKGAIKKFFEYLKRAIDAAIATLLTYKPCDYSEGDKFDRTICHICEKSIEPDEKPCLDHDHVTGNVRGWTHSKCNAQFQLSNVIVVALHSLSSYDAHHIVLGLNTFPGKIDVIAQSEEKYISFTKWYRYNDYKTFKIRFVDTFRFLPNSLENLVKILPKEDLKQTEKIIPANLMHLAKRKGVFPYDHVTSHESFKEKELAPIEAFYNKLTKSACSIEDYEHAQDVWRSFNIQDLGQYSDLYLRTDVTLLADVTEAFRRTSLETYGLDPMHSMTAPSFSWQAMLYKTGVQISLITEVDKLYLFRNNLRGGVAVCTRRHSIADNKYVNPNFDPALKEPTYIVMYDMVSQYSRAMFEYLPLDQFSWMNRKELEYVQQNILSIPDDSERGMFLLCDIEYPIELHDSHSRLIPLLPENIIPPGGKSKKLCNTLADKYNYGLDYRALKQAVRLGLRIIRIHTGVSYRQKPWLRPYIELNTQLREKTKNEFDKAQFKFLNNSIWGKASEDTTKRLEMELVNDKDIFLKRVSDPFFDRATYFAKDIAAVHRRKKKVVYDKPSFVGSVILDLAKVSLNNFMYDHIMPTYGNNVEANYSDTDAVVLTIEGIDPYEVVKEDAKRGTDSWYDCSVYTDPDLHNDLLSRCPGKMVDEFPQKDIKEFVGLRAKCYSILTLNGNKKRLKGIKKYVLQREIGHHDYINTLFNNKDSYAVQSKLVSKKHRIYSSLMKKSSLNSFDDKRFYLSNLMSLPHFHYRVVRHQKLMEKVRVEIVAEWKRRQEERDRMQSETDDIDMEM